MSSLRRGSSGRTGGNRKLYMVPCHSCYVIYGNWRSEEVGGEREVLQSSYIGGKPQSRGNK